MMTQPPTKSCSCTTGGLARLARLGVPGALAEVYAGHLDWYQVARLVQRLPAAAGAAHRRLTSGLARRRRE